MFIFIGIPLTPETCGETLLDIRGGGGVGWRKELDGPVTEGLKLDCTLKCRFDCMLDCGITPEDIPDENILD